MLPYTRSRRPTPTVSARCCSVACSSLGLTRSTTFSALEAHSDNILQHGHRTASLLKIHQRFVYLPDNWTSFLPLYVSLSLSLSPSHALSLSCCLPLSRSLPLSLPPSLFLSLSLSLCSLFFHYFQISSHALQEAKRMCQNPEVVAAKIASLLSREHLLCKNALTSERRCCCCCCCWLTDVSHSD